MLTKSAAALLLGVPAREVDTIADSPAGVVITTIDGTAMLHVADDNPDAEGKTGLMLLAAPTENPVATINGVTTWNGFPVFASYELDDDLTVVEGDESAGSLVDDLTDLTVDELKVIAAGLGVAASGRNKQAQHDSLIEGIRAARAAADDTSVDPAAEQRAALAAELDELTDAELLERAETVGVDGDGRDEMIAALVAAAIAEGQT
jgi:hypothetical protein